MTAIRIGVLLGVLTVSGFAQAAVKPAVAYSDGAKFDNSFNESVFRDGVVRFEATYDIDVTEVNPSSATEFTQALRTHAESGHSPIVAVGFSYADALREVAGEYPNLQFAIIDSVVNAPNVQSLMFKEHEGSFLVGALAALKAEDPVLGFVGGMDLPFIRGFACGYAQGAHYVEDDSRVLVRMIGSTPDAWSNPERGAQLARQLIEADAEVVYAAAGGSGIGVYQAADQAGKLAIAVDSNQNYLHLNTMLTSMVKRVGVAAYQTWAQAAEGRWQPGIQQLGLAEGGVDWALDIFNRQLVPLKMEERVNELRQDIIDGDIKVHSYSTDNRCPVPLIDS